VAAWRTALALSRRGFAACLENLPWVTPEELAEDGLISPT